MPKPTRSPAPSPAADELPSILPADWNWREPDWNLIGRRRLQRFQDIRDDKAAQDGLVAHYAEDCISFINDWGWTSDPRNIEIDKPSLVPFVLFPKQEDFILWVYDRWQNREGGLVEKSRDSGATWLSVAFAVWMWRFRPGAVIGFGSRKEEYVDQLGDPKSIFWKVRKFVGMLPKFLRPKGYEEKRHAFYMKLLNPETGAAIIGEAGTSIGRGARTSIYFVDEKAFLENQDSADSALSETTNCQIDISTPGETIGDGFYKKRMSKRVPVFTFHWKDDPRKGPEWYAKKVESLDSIIVAREIDINYEAAVTNNLMSAEIIDAARAKGPADVSTMGDRRISVDVARYGHNRTVISLVKGRALIWQRVHKKMDTQDTAGLVKAEVDALGGIGKIAQIAVDDIGVGGGVTDTLRRWYPGGKVVGVNASKGVDDGKNWNVRALMYDNLLAWLKDGASVPTDADLRVELLSIKYRFRNGKRLIVSKKDQDSKDFAELAGGSPDRADSLALAFAEPVAPLPPPPPKIEAPVPIDPGVGY